jgi:hypothetical protein
MCLGECGDSYCNSYNDEDMDNCYVDCGSCGDNVCTAGAEDAAHCWDDCGTCTDNICSPVETCGQAHQCTQDCGSCGYVGDDCSTALAECGEEGHFCNAQHYCVAAGGRTCQTEHGCCSNEVWMAMDCDWVYVHEGYAAGVDCEERHCMVGLGCGECIPMGPAAPVRR